MKTLRAHGFNQRPRFEQVVGYLERNEPLLDQPDRKATSFVTSHFYLGPQPPAPAAHASASQGRLPLNALPRPGQAQPPPQIIGRPSDAERLDKAGQRAQEVERGAAQAVEEKVAVAAAVAAEGVGGAFGYWGA